MSLVIQSKTVASRKAQFATNDQMGAKSFSIEISNQRLTKLHAKPTVTLCHVNS